MGEESGDDPSKSSEERERGWEEGDESHEILAAGFTCPGKAAVCSFIQESKREARLEAFVVVGLPLK